jgi:hypothetical protein
VLCQEDFQCVQLLRNTLDVVQAIDSYNKLHTLELLLQNCDTLLNLRLLKAFVEFLWVNADWECADSDQFALEVYTIWRRRKAPCSLSARSTSIKHAGINSQYARTAAQEMARVVVSVESDQIAVENT